MTKRGTPFEMSSFATKESSEKTPKVAFSSLNRNPISSFLLSISSSNLNRVSKTNPRYLSIQGFLVFEVEARRRMMAMAIPTHRM